MKYPAYVPKAVCEEARRLRQSLSPDFGSIIDCLINRSEMEEAYNKLGQIVDTNQMAFYLFAACGATNKFDRYRAQNKEAKLACHRFR